MQKLALGPICHEVTTLEKPGLKVTLATVEDIMAMTMTTVGETTAVTMTTGIVDSSKSENLFP
jgi:hypothetical protein